MKKVLPIILIIVAICGVVVFLIFRGAQTSKNDGSNAAYKEDSTISTGSDESVTIATIDDISETLFSDYSNSDNEDELSSSDESDNIDEENESVSDSQEIEIGEDFIIELEENQTIGGF